MSGPNSHTGNMPPTDDVRNQAQMQTQMCDDINTLNPSRRVEDVDAPDWCRAIFVASLVAGAGVVTYSFASTGTPPRDVLCTALAIGAAAALPVSAHVIITARAERAAAAAAVNRRCARDTQNTSLTPHDRDNCTSERSTVATGVRETALRDGEELVGSVNTSEAHEVCVLEEGAHSGRDNSIAVAQTAATSQGKSPENSCSGHALRNSDRVDLAEDTVERGGMSVALNTNVAVTTGGQVVGSEFGRVDDESALARAFTAQRVVSESRKEAANKEREKLQDLHALTTESTRQDVVRATEARKLADRMALEKEGRVERATRTEAEARGSARRSCQEAERAKLEHAMSTSAVRGEYLQAIEACVELEGRHDSTKAFIKAREEEVQALIASADVLGREHESLRTRFELARTEAAKVSEIVNAANIRTRENEDAMKESQAICRTANGHVSRSQVAKRISMDVKDQCGRRCEEIAKKVAEDESECDRVAAEIDALQLDKRSVAKHNNEEAKRCGEAGKRETRANKDIRALNIEKSLLEIKKEESRHCTVDKRDLMRAKDAVKQHTLRHEELSRRRNALVRNRDAAVRRANASETKVNAMREQLQRKLKVWETQVSEAISAREEAESEYETERQEQDTWIKEYNLPPGQPPGLS